MKLRILRKITYNWHIKLISLGLAFVLWVYVDSLRQKERFVSVPVEVDNVPSGYMVSSDLPSSVKVILRGKENRLAIVDETKLRAYVDLGGSRRDQVRRTVRVDRNLIPQGVSIREVDPRIVDVHIEKVYEKLVTVLPVIINEPPDGYYFEDAQMDPEEVLIKGPESVLGNIETVYTKDLNIMSLTETTLREVGLDIRDSRIIQVEPQVVSVRIIIRTQYVLKRITKEEVIQRDLRDDLTAQIENAPVTAVLRIPKIVENEASPDRFTLVVDLGKVTLPGVYRMPISLETAMPDVTVLRLEPDTVEVKVQKKKQAETKKSV